MELLDIRPFIIIKKKTSAYPGASAENFELEEKHESNRLRCQMNTTEYRILVEVLESIHSNLSLINKLKISEKNWGNQLPNRWIYLTVAYVVPSLFAA